MKIYFFPKTSLGKWSVLMAISAWILFVAGSLIPAKTGLTGFDVVVQNPWQSVLTVLIFAAGITAFIMGLVSIFKRQEISILVFLAIISGLYNIFSFVVVIVNLIVG